MTYALCPMPYALLRLSKVLRILTIFKDCILCYIWPMSHAPCPVPKPCKGRQSAN